MSNGERVQQHSSIARHGLRDLRAPLPDELLHVALRAPEFLDLLLQGMEFFFGQSQNAMARDTAAIAHLKDF